MNNRAEGAFSDSAFPSGVGIFGCPRNARTHGESRVLVETRFEMVTIGVGISYLEGLMRSMVPASHIRGVRVLPREVD